MDDLIYGDRDFAHRPITYIILFYIFYTRYNSVINYYNYTRIRGQTRRHNSE